MEERMVKKNCNRFGCIIFFLATMAYAAEVGGVSIQDKLDTDAGSLVLNGAGIRLHKGDNFTGDKKLRAGMLGE